MTVRASTGTVAGVALIVLGVAALVASAWHGGVREALPALAPAAAAAALGWFAFLAPRLEIGPAGVELVGPVRRTHVPWAAVEGADAEWGLRIDTRSGRPVRWSALGRVDRRDGGYVEGVTGYITSAFTRYRAAERHVRAAGSRDAGTVGPGDALPLWRWTDQTSTAHDTVRLSAAQTALVIMEYRDALGERGAGDAGGAGIRRTVRILPALAILAPLAATILLFT